MMRSRSKDTIVFASQLMPDADTRFAGPRSKRFLLPQKYRMMRSICVTNVITGFCTVLPAPFQFIRFEEHLEAWALSHLPTYLDLDPRSTALGETALLSPICGRSAPGGITTVISGSTVSSAWDSRQKVGREFLVRESVRSHLARLYPVPLSPVHTTHWVTSTNGRFDAFYIWCLQDSTRDKDLRASLDRQPTNCLHTTVLKKHQISSHNGYNTGRAALSYLP